MNDMTRRVGDCTHTGLGTILCQTIQSMHLAVTPTRDRIGRVHTSKSKLQIHRTLVLGSFPVQGKEDKVQAEIAVRSDLQKSSFL